jgi:hypothetical protein
MTERKPHGVTFEAWTDKLVREAMERGEFDNLPGAGKPIPGIDEPYDEMWWVKQKLRRENVSMLPPSLALRKEAEDALASAANATSETQARRIVRDINVKISNANTRPLAGPPLNLVPFNVERIVDQWRSDHPGTATPGAREVLEALSGNGAAPGGGKGQSAPAPVGVGTQRRLVR